jgi:hypothetical protein
MCQAFWPHKNYHNDVEEAARLGFRISSSRHDVAVVHPEMMTTFWRGWHVGGG